jgi:NDP-sugar pyrophosphorylase family protein
MEEILGSLWQKESIPWLEPLVPRSLEALKHGYARLRAGLERAPEEMAGEIARGAMIEGEIVSMGRESRIEAGAVVHRSCRLVLGEGSVVRSGAVLRDEVIIGNRCLVGAHCEVVRSIILGPDSALGHFVFLADSVIGREVNVSGYVATANTTVAPGKTINLKYGVERLESGREHLGALVGDGVRFGASTTMMPGCIVLPGLSLPPGVVLYGTIDRSKQELLLRRFYETWDFDRLDRRSKS